MKLPKWLRRKAKPPEGRHRRNTTYPPIHGLKGGSPATRWIFGDHDQDHSDDTPPNDGGSMKLRTALTTGLLAALGIAVAVLATDGHGSTSHGLAETITTQTATATETATVTQSAPVPTVTVTRPGATRTVSQPGAISVVTSTATQQAPGAVSTVTQVSQVPGRTVTRSQTVSGPRSTVTRTNAIQAPAQTVTVTASAPSESPTSDTSTPAATQPEMLSLTAIRSGSSVAISWTSANADAVMVSINGGTAQHFEPSGNFIFGSADIVHVEAFAVSTNGAESGHLTAQA